MKPMLRREGREFMAIVQHVKALETGNVEAAPKFVREKSQFRID